MQAQYNPNLKAIPMKIINLIAFLLMIAMNYLANSLPINGKTTGMVSAEYPNLFTPAGITFSIWGVIYLLLLLTVILQFRAGQKESLSLIGWAFVMSCIFNALWIVAWHYGQTTLSVLLMLGLLASLIFINLKMSAAPLGLVKASFGIYLGWICIATIANVTALLVKINWSAFGVSEEIWSILMVFIGLAITLVSIIRFQNPFIAIPVAWAFTGILLKRQSDFMSIVIASGIAIALLLVFIVWWLIRRLS